MSAIFLTTKKRFGNRGVTLIETFLYVVTLALLMGVIVQMLISIGGIYKNLKLTRELESSGTIVMESMLREIRNASSVVLSQSALGSNPGALTVSGTDESSNPYKVYFGVSSGKVVISRNDGAPEILTSSLGTVDRLVFKRVATSTSEGIRIELQVSGTSGTVSKNERFYGFSILRGSY